MSVMPEPALADVRIVLLVKIADAARTPFRDDKSGRGAFRDDGVPPDFA
jgi:hypothetical protein